jgi:hypothetical protein
MKNQKKIAFDFVLEQMAILQPIVRPMFGCHAIYVGEKLMLVTREKGGSDSDDGIWIATRKEYHESLRRDLPSLCSIRILGNGETNWQVIPKRSDTFEEEVMKACDLIKKNDLRIGSIPKSKKKYKKQTPIQKR